MMLASFADFEASPGGDSSQGRVSAKASNVIRAFEPAMNERRQRVIVHISSSWGRSGERELAPNCASKFAIEGLTQSLSMELPKGMAVVALDPGGAIDTPMPRACAPQ